MLHKIQFRSFCIFKKSVLPRVGLIVLVYCSKILPPAAHPALPPRHLPPAPPPIVASSPALLLLLLLLLLLPPASLQRALATKAGLGNDRRAAALARVVLGEAAHPVVVGEPKEMISHCLVCLNDTSLKPRTLLFLENKEMINHCLIYLHVIVLKVAPGLCSTTAF